MCGVNISRANMISSFSPIRSNNMPIRMSRRGTLNTLSSQAKLHSPKTYIQVYCQCPWILYYYGIFCRLIRWCAKQCSQMFWISLWPSTLKETLFIWGNHTHTHTNTHIYSDWFIKNLVTSIDATKYSIKCFLPKWSINFNMKMETL